MNSSWKLLVFDWDGTLSDSAARIVHAMQNAAADIGIEKADDRAIRDIIGLSLDHAAYQLHPELDGKAVERFSDAYRSRYRSQALGGVQLFPQVAATLATLKQHFTLAVATGKGRAGLDRELAESGLAEFFALTRCADETRSKPDPQMLKEIMTDIDVTPAETLMIGDTEFDLEMAERARAGAVAVTYGAHAVERLQRRKPLTLIDDICQLPPWLATQAA